ncbi:unnamed protein product [Parascedosporium putredinis]|uniref:RWD domain-containing protein n=1 Tax=Parascedosporium putredinis TaxID=1442378 RepID=A0A9P1MDJ2_9PEZI|nr:unnamed protein product [Parascedosporium putredinis]CAI7998677.1 unnamed protein product [Parascedosporium putredinis]
MRQRVASHIENMEMDNSTVTPWTRILPILFGSTAQESQMPDLGSFLRYAEHCLGSTHAAHFQPLLQAAELSGTGDSVSGSLVDFIILMVKSLQSLLNTRSPPSFAIPRPTFDKAVDHILTAAGIATEKQRTLRDPAQQALFATIGVFSTLYEPAVGVYADFYFVQQNSARPVPVGPYFNYSPLSELFWELEMFQHLEAVTPRYLAPRCRHATRNTADLLSLPKISLSALLATCKISVHWTNSLDEHLVLNQDTRTITLFRYPSFCAATWMAGDGNFLASMISWHFVYTVGNVFMSSELPFLGNRLLNLQMFGERHKPMKLFDLYRDRRETEKYYTFWAVIWIGGASLLLSVVQVALAIMQVPQYCHRTSPPRVSSMGGSKQRYGREHDNVPLAAFPGKIGLGRGVSSKTCRWGDAMPSVPTPPTGTQPTNAGIITDVVSGERHIPSSTRADGSTRKAIKIRPGYRPPEDIELYKNRTAEAFRDRAKTVGIPGAAVAEEADESAKAGASSATSNKNAKRREARKKAKAVGADESGVAAGDAKAAQPAAKEDAKPAKTEEAEADPEVERQKKARNLKKKLKQAKDLKNKKEGGETLLPEQIAKVIKINELIRELDALGFDAEGEPKEEASPASNAKRIHKIKYRESRIDAVAFNKMGREEQVEEREVLESIFPEEITGAAPRPHVRPQRRLPPQLLLSEDRDVLLEALNTAAEENLGMAMVFALVSTVKEAAEQLIADREAAVEKVREEAARAAEQEENKKFHGTSVTPESFMKWREGFLREMEEQRLKEEEERLAELKKARVKEPGVEKLKVEAA